MTTLRILAAAALLLFTQDVWAFRGRPVSDLRFEGHRELWPRVASDGRDFMTLSSMPRTFPTPLVTQKVVDGRAVGPQRYVATGEGIGLEWTGEAYLAAWRTNTGIWAGRISRDGTPVSEPAGPAIETPPSTMASLAVGTHSAMLFDSRRNELVVRALDFNGDPAGYPLTYAVPSAYGIGAAAASGFAFVMISSTSTSVLLLNPSGTLFTPVPIVIDGPYTSDFEAFQPVAGTDGADTLILFSVRQKSTNTTTLYSVVLGADGTVESKRSVRSVTGPELTPGSVHALVWDGSQYVAILEVDGDAVEPSVNRSAMIRLTRDGQLAAEAPWPDAPRHAVWNPVTLAWNGSRFLTNVADGIGSVGTWDPGVATVDAATLLPGPMIGLGRTLTTHEGLTIGEGPGGYLAAWLDRGRGEATVRASRIDTAGNYLDGEGIVLATVPPSTRAFKGEIAIAGTGPSWFVTWSVGRELYGRGISRNGTPGSGEAIPIGPADAADVLWNGSHYLVLRAGNDLELDVIAPNGTIVETRTLMAGTAPNQNVTVTFYEPHLALLANRPVAIFDRVLTACGFPFCYDSLELYGMRLDDATAAPLRIDDYMLGYTSVAAGPDRLLVTWSDESEVRGAYLGANDFERPGTPFVIADSSGMSAVAYDGEGFVGVWQTWEGFAFGRITPSGTVTNVVEVSPGYRHVVQIGIAGAPGLTPLVGFISEHPAYDAVQRATVAYASELDDTPPLPPAPSIVCATDNGDDTLTVRWQPASNALGIQIELQLPDGTFRAIGVAPAGATSVRVGRAGLSGSAVRVRAWNQTGLSAPSAIATSSVAPSATLRSAMRTCAGKPLAVPFTLSGIAPFAVRWSDGLVQSNLQANATRIVNLTHDTTLRIVSVSDASCAASTESQSIAILVDPAAEIANQTRELTIARGQTATLRVTADDDLSFAWYEGNVGDRSKLVGTNAPAFTTPPLSATTRYWVRVSGRCGSVDSAQMTVSVSSGGGKGRAVRK